MRDGGKGDAKRPLTVPKEEFEANWNNIFKGTKKMDALEMADELEEGAKYCEDHGTIARRVLKAAAILRQQAEEIEELKQYKENNQ